MIESTARTLTPDQISNLLADLERRFKSESVEQQSVHPNIEKIKQNAKTGFQKIQQDAARARGQRKKLREDFVFPKVERPDHAKLLEDCVASLAHAVMQRKKEEYHKPGVLNAARRLWSNQSKMNKNWTSFEFDESVALEEATHEVIDL